MSNTPRIVVDFLRSVLSSAEMGGSRGYLDMFADRLVKAASSPTLSLAVEDLLRSVNASIHGLAPTACVEMVRIANSSDGPRVLRWWRQQAKLVALLAGSRDKKAVDEALSTVVLPEGSGQGCATPRRPSAIAITATCQSPLAHGADSKAGNATLFRRLPVITDTGDVLHLPYYAGNAVRGQMRDLLADHFLAAIGLTPSRSTPPVALWFFYALYSGGALEEQSDAQKALRKSMGDHGAIRAMGIREFRQMLPALSLLGCALGNRVLPGRCQFADLRPVCAEWGTGESSISELMAWEYLTRREDYEDHTEHHGMIASTEVLRTGARLEGGIDHDGAMDAIERAALGRGLTLLAARGFLGAENRRGLGRVTLTIDGAPSPDAYDEFLRDRKDAIREYLLSVGAIETAPTLV